MTAADWLVAFFMLVASVLLFVGLAQALDSTGQGQHRSRRSRGSRPARPPASRAETQPAAARVGMPTAVDQSSGRGGGFATAPAPSPVTSVAPEVPVEEPPPVNVVEACQVLYREGHHADVLRRVASHVSLAQGAEPYETALLWTLAALAHESIGEPEEARAAYDAAAWVMPDSRAPVPAWLGDAGGAVLRWLVAPSRHGGDGSPRSGTRLCLSLSWLRALGASGSEDATAAITEVGDRLWTECAKRANGFLSQQEFESARDLAQEALAYGALPPGRQEEFRELVSMSLAAEIGRLMSKALERLESPEEALAALDRGEASLRSVPAEFLESRQHQELERRLWWGYSRLGLQRFEAGAAEEAVAVLLRALSMAELDVERNSETRQALARAFEAWGAQARETVARDLAAGNRGAAADEVRRFRDALGRAIELGVKETDVAGAIAASEALQESAERG